VISLVVLWTFYGFRYRARPGGMEINPPLAESLSEISKPWEGKVLGTLARFRALPESYLYGMADIQSVDDFYTSYFFGKLYAHGIPLYFPGVIVIKSTLPLLILLLVAAMLMAMRKFTRWREILFLTVPPAVYLAVAMSSQMNIGVRHILPMYPFLMILAAGAASALMRRGRRWIQIGRVSVHIWTLAVAVLLLWQVVTVLRVFPVYMAYGNEAWGGPKNVHKYLSDSNVDWAQQLIATKKYLDARGIHDCWFVYFAEAVVDMQSYGIPCQALPTTETLWWMNLPRETPAAVDGIFLISEGDMAGVDFGPGALNPYEQFTALKPVATIQHGIYVYAGHFEIPLAAGLSHVQKAQNFLAVKNIDAARAEAEKGIELAPDSVMANTAMGDVLAAQNRRDEARQYYERALKLAQTVYPDFQVGWVSGLQEKLAAK
jgi:tetratricopeptide (TPR) repeat protein